MTYEVYAVCDEKGQPDLKTLYPHERGAKVNWLARLGVPLSNGIPESVIHEVFDLYREAKGVSVRKFILTGPPN